MELTRGYGILLHPTSLPGPWGIGNLGDEARAFVDWLQAAGASWWQTLPVGPTGFGDSPYQAVSSFAGNPYLIDPEHLVQRGWLAEQERTSFPAGWVDYGWIYASRWPLLRQAFAGFKRKARAADKRRLTAFRESQRFWLEDYALFRALKTRHEERPWDRWPEPLQHRGEAALGEARRALSEDTDFHAWTQWQFSEAWAALRAYARERGVRLIGDIPIFVAHDSPEVWAHPELFHMDESGHPTVVAGVPPDYFSATGQLWGNPLYRWERMAEDGYAWWTERLRTALATCDLVRIDHFRGFEAYWEVPAGATNAIGGRWVPGPGRALFDALRLALGDAPVLAEDLGLITPEVEALRDGLGFPGMKVLQFAFDGDLHNGFLPHLHPEHGNFVVYPGTHDNETSLGWYRNLARKLRAAFQDYLLSYELACQPEAEVSWSMLDLAMRSPGQLAVAPLQDVLGLGNEARMNTPSTAEGNWTWRFQRGDLTPGRAERCRQLAARHLRLVEGG
jgi:4-alpha-glucanotransferase